MIKIVARITGVFILAVIIWNFISYLNNTYLAVEYNRASHFFIAILTAVLSIMVIDIARRLDRISWKQLGMSSVRNNILSFMVGFILWTIPAAIGLVICVMAGWVEITVQTNVNQLLMSVLILFITVFFIEALSEELIFRGYLYRHLQALFPHWATVLLQALLFTLFAYLIGAMYSFEQLLFLPGFAFLLGYFRAISGNVWTAVGFHAAIMTVTQMLSPLHNHFEVTGMFTLQFIVFILLPSVVGAIALEFIYPKHNWRHKEPLLTHR